MPHKLVDFVCESCGHVWEDIKMPGDTKVLHICPNCGSNLLSQALGGHMTKCHDSAVREQVLRKRSIDHSNLHAKENLEKLQNKGVLKLK